jgi:hypothetical protein
MKCELVIFVNLSTCELQVCELVILRTCDFYELVIL